MKPIRDAAPQLNQNPFAGPESVEQDDSSISGVRPVLRPELDRERDVSPTSGGATSDLTVVFRGVLPMERLVQLIRRRAGESTTGTSMRVEVEQLAPASLAEETGRWRVRLHTDRGEFAASEPGPFLAVTRAFSLLQ